jgi:hypothetical protein
MPSFRRFPRSILPCQNTQAGGSVDPISMLIGIWGLAYALSLPQYLSDSTTDEGTPEGA